MIRNNSLSGSFELDSQRIIMDFQLRSYVLRFNYLSAYVSSLNFKPWSPEKIFLIAKAWSSSPSNLIMTMSGTSHHVI